MGHFPYLVQYFSCKHWEQSNKEIQDMIKVFAYLDATLIGPIQGETGIPGLKIDFNNGLRLQIPAGNWHVTIGDYDSGMVFYDMDACEVVLVSSEKYYIHWQIEVFLDGQPVFGHIFDPTGQKIRLFFETYLLGDMQSFLPYIPAARDWYQADVYCTINKSMWDICRRLFPELRLRDVAEENTYATYFFSACMDYSAGMPLDGRTVSMIHTGRIILGLPELPQKVPWISGVRQIKEPYVCIGVQASSTAKGWLFPGGWEIVVRYLKELGYRVLCIDRDKKFEQFGYVLEMPDGAEDFTGERPLLERADMLHFADFFIGLSSGLSWLAYTADCPVIMIAGFTSFWYEFPTPYRVSNRLACSGCYNDVRLTWQKNVCARQQRDTEDILQCSKTITPRMVIQAIDRLIADKKAGRIKHA